jgi:hypothetical protein
LEKSSFFNSVAGDRKYQASDFASFFNSLLTNGVFPNPSTNLQVISNNNMTITVKAGKAWINGYVYINDSDLILPVTVADGVLKRIDRVVIQYSTINREIKIKVKKGTFASSPFAPILQRDADIYELGIADISIVNGATSITQANITDLRLNTTYCGWVNSLIQADTTAIFNQYQAWFTTQSGTYNNQMIENEAAFQVQFNTWFDTVKEQLSGDIAGNLQNQITQLDTDLGDLEETVTSHKADYLYQTAGGTATVITLTGVVLEDGHPKTFIASANNGGVATTVNSKPLYKPNTTTSPTLIAGKAYTLWYNLAGDRFFIKASAEGTATTAQVLAGVPFSNETDTGLIGTMPEQGSPTLQPGATIPAGHYSGGSVANPNPSSGNQTYSTAGTYSFTVPSGVTRLLVELWGGGGAGGTSSTSYTYNPNGAGGGEFVCGLLNVTPGQVISAVVGAGGIAPTSPGTGGNGGNTSFGTMTAIGGGGGWSQGTGGTGGVNGSVPLIACAGAIGNTGTGGGCSGGGGGFPTVGTNQNSGNVSPAQLGIVAGGKGGTGATSTSYATSGTSPGGGGGSGTYLNNTYGKGGDGGTGRIYLKW